MLKSMSGTMFKMEKRKEHFQAAKDFVMKATLLWFQNIFLCGKMPQLPSIVIKYDPLLSVIVIDGLQPLNPPI